MFLPLSRSKEKKLPLRLQFREIGLDQSRGISEIKTREKWIGWPIRPKGIGLFIVFSSTASWCKPVSCYNLQHISNLLGQLWFQPEPSFLGLTARIRLQWQPWGTLKGRSGTTWRQNYPTPSCLRCHFFQSEQRLYGKDSNLHSDEHILSAGNPCPLWWVHFYPCPCHHSWIIFFLNAFP